MSRHINKASDKLITQAQWLAVTLTRVELDRCIAECNQHDRLLSRFQAFVLGVWFNPFPPLITTNTSLQGGDTRNKEDI